MWPESNEKNTPLKSGLTTGCCATACCVAGARFLFKNHKARRVSVTLPKGKVVELSVIRYLTRSQNQVQTATIKDAGDDPDVTHGATVFVNLKLTEQPGIQFKADNGVGTVTRAGLLLAVGEPAINPVPRKMIADHLTGIADENNYKGGFEVAVGVENGEQIAKKTMNARLGIIGGLSILGTTGVVRPFSCSAYIASIHQGIDVAVANGFQHIAASTGSSSEDAIKNLYQLPDIALIEMGDFVGAVLKYVKKVPIKKLSLCGGFGKISKLANGQLDLHSRVNAIDFNFLAELAIEQDTDKSIKERILLSNTSIEALDICNRENIDLAGRVCKKAFKIARKIVPARTELEVCAINRQGEIIASVKEFSS